MIAPAKRSRNVRPRWHAAFLVMLPTIVQQLRVAFRHLRDEAREEAVTEGLANACSAYQRLARQGRTHLAFPSALARFAATQVRDGRLVGSGQNSRDVLSRRAQRRKQFQVERLDRFENEENEWLEAVVEDPHTSVFEQVCFRVDFPDWLNRLTPRNRRVAEFLALSHSTSAAARHFRISPGRVSQIRRELYVSWQEFCGETNGLASVAGSSR
ncbi:MAG: hypothetical protein AB7O62_02360 [Pirellulales bacterium]